MSSSNLTDELRRFINTITSIPHLETMLLLQQTVGEVWNVSAIAQRMYIGEAQAGAMLKDLTEAGICKPVSDQAEEFIYCPAFEELGQLIDQLAEYYPRNLIQVTNMIHARSASGQRVQMFADAFKFLKDK